MGYLGTIVIATGLFFAGLVLGTESLDVFDLSDPDLFRVALSCATVCIGALALYYAIATRLRNEAHQLLSTIGNDVHGKDPRQMDTVERRNIIRRLRCARRLTSHSITWDSALSSEDRNTLRWIVLRALEVGPPVRDYTKVQPILALLRDGEGV